jgi:hypothetical protein
MTLTTFNSSTLTLSRLACTIASIHYQQTSFYFVNMHGPYIGTAPTSLGNAKPKDLGQEILGPQRLLPRIIEFNAIAHPTKLYAVFPKSESFEDGLQELTYKDLANSINRISWWLDEKLGKSGSFDTFAYIGLKDIRYSLLAVAAIKSGRRVS